jgi:ribosome-binding factor A
MSGYRIEKVNNLIQEVLSRLIARDFCAPAGCLVSLTRVECHGNLQEAEVFISVLPDRERETVVASLERSAYQFQEKLNKQLRMRPVPKIIFIGDNLPRQAQEVETLLEQLKDPSKH